MELLKGFVVVGLLICNEYGGLFAVTTCRLEILKVLLLVHYIGFSSFHANSYVQCLGRTIPGSLRRGFT